eukprot:scaffold155672_cov27-Tisochrysis_lutea.AAC.1
MNDGCQVSFTIITNHCQPTPININQYQSSGIAHLVEEAQINEAPVQRLADAVAGRFCYGVMTASAATFAFWSLFGVNAFPWVLDSSIFAGGFCEVEIGAGGCCIEVMVAVRYCMKGANAGGCAGGEKLQPLCHVCVTQH